MAMVTSLFICDTSQGFYDASTASRGPLVPLRCDAALRQRDASKTLDVTHDHETYLQVTSECDACDTNRISFNFFERDYVNPFSNCNIFQYHASLRHCVTVFVGGDAR